MDAIGGDEEFAGRLADGSPLPWSTKWARTPLVQRLPSGEVTAGVDAVGAERLEAASRRIFWSAPRWMENWGQR